MTDLSLTVFIVFFGTAPPWLPLTLQSMANNRGVSFVVIGDVSPPAILPPNVRFEYIGFEAMQARLADFLGANRSSVRHTEHYKANDYKPFAPALYPHLLGKSAWWAWGDLDVVFGDLGRFMQMAMARPACCRVPLRKDGTPRSKRLVNVYLHRDACPCKAGEEVNVLSPLYPNPWAKKAWGPFTVRPVSPVVVQRRCCFALRGTTWAAFRAQAFRVGFGTELFRRSAQWRAVVRAIAYHRVGQPPRQPDRGSGARAAGGVA